MTPLRGAILILAGVIALYEGWRIGHGPRVYWAVALGLVAIAVGVWRLPHPEPPRRLK